MGNILRFPKRRVSTAWEAEKRREKKRQAVSAWLEQHDVSYAGSETYEFLVKKFNPERGFSFCRDLIREVSADSFMRNGDDPNSYFGGGGQSLARVRRSLRELEEKGLIAKQWRRIRFRRGKKLSPPQLVYIFQQAPWKAEAGVS
jgi:hypothetical protein